MRPVRDWTRDALQHTLGRTPPDGDGEVLHLVYGRGMDTPVDTTIRGVYLDYTYYINILECVLELYILY